MSETGKDLRFLFGRSRVGSPDRLRALQGLTGLIGRYWNVLQEPDR